MSETTNKTENAREQKLFKEMPVWKSLLKMSIPSMIIMLVFGMYTFIDNVLAINLASDSYEKIAVYEPKDQVRLYMSAMGPVTTFMFAVTMLFGVGVSRRYSINIGAKREQRAIDTLKTTNQFALGLSFLLIPVLLLTAKPWMKAQFDGNPQMASIIADRGYDFVWIIIISLPFQMFNTIISSAFRAEARNKQMLIAMVLPIGFNLLFDWIFMGPAGMGIEGGAWATAISYVLTTILLVFYMMSIPDTRIKFKNVFGRNGFKLITLVGVCLVGIAPFMRNMAQSITQSVEMRQIQDVSQSVYGNNMQMSVIMTAVFPVFGLFFPMMFGFIQAGSPIAGYNYGAGNMQRVKQTTWFIVLYSTITAIIIFSISTFWLIDPLNSLLGIEDKPYQFIEMREIPAGQTTTYVPTPSDLVPVAGYKTFGDMFPGTSTAFANSYDMTNGAPTVLHQGGKSFNVFIHTLTNSNFHTLDKAQKMYGIMMVSVMFFGPALGAMSLFGSTDRPLFNLIASSLRGVILLVPVLLLFASITKDMSHDIVQNNLGTNGIFTQEFFFWWFYPILAATTSIILMIIAVFVMKKLDQKHTPLEERIAKVHEWNKRRIEHKKTKKLSK